jgi:hypothetical protein
MDRNEIEAQIRQILREETKAIALSNKLFRPDGLFARLAATETERREVSKSPLFQEAQDRLSELQQAEMDEFRKAIAAVGDRLPGGLVSYRSEELTAGK